jgi:methylaspartate mutase epsilon subunit
MQIKNRKLNDEEIFQERKAEVYAVTGMGKATIQEQVDLWRYVKDFGEADLLGTSVDSFSRVLDFGKSEKGIEESLHAGKSILNGVPMVNHGVKNIRKMIVAVNLPVGLRYGAVDRRLIDDIGIAGGHTSTAPYGFLHLFVQKYEILL